MPAKGSKPSDVSMMMPNMAMSADCMGDAQHSDKKIPSKNSGNNCGMCVTCGLPISTALLTEGAYLSRDPVFTYDVNRDGIVVPPALPPPIA